MKGAPMNGYQEMRHIRECVQGANHRIGIDLKKDKANDMHENETPACHRKQPILGGN